MESSFTCQVVLGIPKLHFKYSYVFVDHRSVNILCPELLTNVAVLRLEKTSLHVLDRNKQHYQMNGNIARQTQFPIKSISLLMDSVLMLH